MWFIVLEMLFMDMIPLGQMSVDGRGLPVYPTREGTRYEDRMSIIDIMRPDLASCLDLSSMLKQAHWNVKGYNFIAVHKLFDEIYDYLTGVADLLGERIAAYGGTALSSTRFVLSNSYIVPYPDTAVGCCAHLTAVADRLAILSNTYVRSIDRLDSLGSKVTSNVYQDIVFNLDKYLYFVESHIQAPEEYHAEISQQENLPS